jgi:hypothetical protein
VKVNIGFNLVNMPYVAVTHLYECGDEHSGSIRTKIFVISRKSVSEEDFMMWLLFIY